MSCEFNCSKCCKLLKTTSATIIGTGANQKLKLTIPSMDFYNLENYCLVICNKIPESCGILPVVIYSKSEIPLLTRFGNIVRDDQLKSKHKYRVVFGNDKPHFLIQNVLPCTNYTPV